MAAVVARDSLQESSKDGAFVRTESIFRKRITEGGEFPPEAGRYLLYVSFACPWASRCLAVRALKGLEAVIDVATVAPVWAPTKPGIDTHRGWVFDPTVPGATADPLFGAKTLREVYEKAGGETAHKFTVPLLVDKVTRKIVNNESQEIVRDFNERFQGLATKNVGLDLYPPPLRPAIDAINDDIYHAINNGVYKCGFATAQAPYEAAFAALFAALDKYEAHLRGSRYLMGDSLTEADIRLFKTLIRFDPVYVSHFKCNRDMIRTGFPVLYNYMRDIYQIPGIRECVNFEQIKQHYFRSHPSINPHGIVAHGIDEDAALLAPRK